MNDREILDAIEKCFLRATDEQTALWQTVQPSWTEDHEDLLIRFKDEVGALLNRRPKSRPE